MLQLDVAANIRKTFGKTTFQGFGWPSSKNGLFRFMSLIINRQTFLASTHKIESRTAPK